MNHAEHEFIRKYERETWSRCADNYLDTFSKLTDVMLPKLIEAVRVASGSRVLDLGCGPGNSSRALADAGASVTGIDFSQEMIDAARAGNSGITFKNSDLEDLPEEDSSFDAVIANYVVHHLPDPGQVFSEVARVLKPGGSFAFAQWGPPEEQSSIGAFVQALSQHHSMAELPHGPLFGVTDQETFGALADAAGLSNFTLATHSTLWECPTLDPVIDGFWSWADLGELPRDTQDRIRTSMHENCQPFLEAGVFKLPHTAILGRAIKG